MMVNFTDLLKDAQRHKYAVGSFNVYSYETIRGVIEAGRELGFPTIVAFAEGYLQNMDLDEVFAIVHTMARKSSVPVVLHLDHCKSFINIVKAIRAGFTSVMFDGSNLPIEENIKKSAEVVAIAHAV